MSQDETLDQPQPGAPSSPSPGASTLPPSDEARPLDQEVTRLAERERELEDQIMRLRAEMENLRRRSEREKSDMLRYGLEKCLSDLLPVLDSFDQALATLPANVDGDVARQPPQVADLRGGLELIHKQMIDFCRKQGLESIKTEGARFDPAEHQAIRRVEADVSEETVAERYAQGYRLNGRVIRAAVVSVAVPAAAP